MLNNVKDIKDLMKVAIKVESGEKVIVHWPQFNKNQEQTFNLDRDRCVNEHTYNTNNSVIAFYEQGTLYVVPYFDKAIRILEEEEFKPSEMFVPFSNREYPLIHKKQWLKMFEEARQLIKERYEAECIELSEKLGVQPVPQELLDQKCLNIPEEGILVAGENISEIRYYPVVFGFCCDNLTLDYLGRYCVKNGIISFVNADGKQYVTKSDKIHRILIDLGFKYRKFDVIFSNGEEAIDEIIADYWNSL